MGWFAGPLILTLPKYYYTNLRAAFVTRAREGHGPECCVGTDHTPGHATTRPLRPWMRSLQGKRATAEQRTGTEGQLCNANNACR